MDYLQGVTIPLGLVAQIFRGQGMPLKWVLASMFVICIGLVWLARGPEDTIQKTVFEGIFWMSSTLGAMFGTASASYAYAAGGSNPEERSARAQSVLVPVTDPNKVITAKE